MQTSLQPVDFLIKESVNVAISLHKGIVWGVLERA
jgi:hypothetical protein